MDEVSKESLYIKGLALTDQRAYPHRPLNFDRWIKGPCNMNRMMTASTLPERSLPILLLLSVCCVSHFFLTCSTSHFLPTGPALLSPSSSHNTLGEEACVNLLDLPTRGELRIFFASVLLIVLILC